MVAAVTGHRTTKSCGAGSTVQSGGFAESCGFRVLVRGSGFRSARWRGACRAIRYGWGAETGRAGRVATGLRAQAARVRIYENGKSGRTGDFAQFLSEEKFAELRRLADRAIGANTNLQEYLRTTPDSFQRRRTQKPKRRPED